MLKPITNKGLFWELRNSIWTLWAFFPFGFFNYISFFYTASRLRDKKLFLYGCLYAIPFIHFVIMVDKENLSEGYENFMFLLLIGTWIISLFHVVKVRRYYVLQLAHNISYVEQLTNENKHLHEKLKNATDAQRTPNMSLEKQAAAPTERVEATNSTLIDVNTATEQQLANIDEIGALLANKVVLSRAQVGAFNDYEHFIQLMAFKPHIAHKLQKHITVVAATQEAQPKAPQGRVIDY